MQDENKKAVLIPNGVLLANFSREGYFLRVSFHAKECTTYREAWEKTEDELEQYNLPQRYSSYETFRSCRSRWVRDLNSIK